MTLKKIKTTIALIFTLTSPGDTMEHYNTANKSRQSTSEDQCLWALHIESGEGSYLSSDTIDWICLYDIGDMKFTNEVSYQALINDYYFHILNNINNDPQNLEQFFQKNEWIKIIKKTPLTKDEFNQELKNNESFCYLMKISVGEKGQKHINYKNYLYYYNFTQLKKISSDFHSAQNKIGEKKGPTGNFMEAADGREDYPKYEVYPKHT